MIIISLKNYYYRIKVQQFDMKRYKNIKEMQNCQIRVKSNDIV